MCRINNSTLPTRSRSQFKVMGLSLEFRVHSVSLLPLGWFSLDFGQMFICGTMCRIYKSAMGTQGQGHSSRSRVWALNFVSTRYLLYPWKNFLLILVKCLPQWNDVLNHAQPCRLTRSQFKVTIKFCVRSLSPLPLGGFSLNFDQMFSSVGQCAEPITQPCRLNVNVTVEGHEFEPWIWCRLHISFTPGRIFFKRLSNVCLSEIMCRTYNSAMLTQGQGHSWRSPVWAVNFEAAPLPFRLPC